MQTYCGNNAIHPELLNGNKIIGTRYSCLKKGIATGLRLPYDVNYSFPFQPIDNTQIYCGNSEILPENYDRFGNLPQCLQKGVAIGKVQKAQMGEPLNSEKLKYIIFLIFSISLFIIFYKIKPKFLLKKDEDKNNININWKKFILFYFTILIFFYLFLFYLIQ